MFEINCNITYKYVCLCTLCLQMLIFRYKRVLYKSVIYNKTYSLKWFPFKESHWYITYYTHYPRFRIQKKIHSEKDKRDFKT